MQGNLYIHFKTSRKAKGTPRDIHLMVRGNRRCTKYFFQRQSLKGIKNRTKGTSNRFDAFSKKNLVAIMFREEEFSQLCKS